LSSIKHDAAASEPLGCVFRSHPAMDNSSIIRKEVA